MKTTFAVLLFGMFLASPVSGAEIFGTISEGGSALPAGVPVTLACGEAQASAKTDEFGSYNLRISETGDCKLSVEYKGAAATLPVAVFAKPTRYDLAAKLDAGKLVLTRK
jgi:hypothetical protein